MFNVKIKKTNGLFRDVSEQTSSWPHEKCENTAAWGNSVVPETTASDKALPWMHLKLPLVSKIEFFYSFPFECKYVRWVPLTMNSVTTSKYAKDHCIHSDTYYTIFNMKNKSKHWTSKCIHVTRVNRRRSWAQAQWFQRQRLRETRNTTRS